jgi:ribosomal protein L16 Arg81 hydroxylase
VDPIEFLKPYSWDEFKKSIWGRSCLHVPGYPGKFSEIVTWSALNNILVERQLSSPRIELAKDGQRIDDRFYIDSPTLERGMTAPRIIAAKFYQKLREGSTLIVNFMDEMYGPIRDVSEMLEHELHEGVHVNAYVAWGRTLGFKAHQDDHDAFILQISGRKYWRIYEMGERSTASSEAKQNKLPPRKISWEGMLEEGDLLYIPEDWWHEARAQGEPSLHLTCGFRNRNGRDLLAWLYKELECVELFRTGLPRFASDEIQAVHLKKLREELLERLGEDAVSRFFQDQDAKPMMSRSHLSLPWGVVAGELPQDDAVSVRFLLDVDTPFSLTVDRQRCQLVANGNRWQFPNGSEFVLKTLMARRVCSVSDLVASAPTLSREAVRWIVSDLIFQGLAALASSAST